MRVDRLHRGDQHRRRAQGSRLGDPVVLDQIEHVLTAFGGSFIKPSVLGTVAVTTTEKTKSLGFALYYWLVNAGAMIGPTIAYFVRDQYGNQFVYLVSAVSCLAMLAVNLLFYKEVRNEAAAVTESMGKKIANLFRVLGNVRFMIFLLIYSLYWIIFWQEFIIIPYYITDYIGREVPYEIITSWAGAGAIILFQIPVNRLTRNVPTHQAILIGFAVSSLIWIIIGIHPSVPTIAAGIAAFSIGEMIQAPRYYEYISEIAPPGQQGLFQGYAFLPIAIGTARQFAIPDALCHPLRTVRLSSPTETAVFRASEPVACVIDVRETYRHLARRAEAAGAGRSAPAGKAAAAWRALPPGERAPISSWPRSRRSSTG